MRASVGSLQDPGHGGHQCPLQPLIRRQIQGQPNHGLPAAAQQQRTAQRPQFPHAADDFQILLMPEHEEIERVVPIIEAVKAAFDVPVSLDTYKARVASAGIAAGADLIIPCFQSSSYCPPFLYPNFNLCPWHFRAIPYRIKIPLSPPKMHHPGTPRIIPWKGR